MGVWATRDTTACAPIDALTLRGEPAVTADLLVMAKTHTLGNLRLTAMGDATAAAPDLVLPLGRKAAMAAQLLVVPWAVTSRTGCALTMGCTALGEATGFEVVVGVHVESRWYASGTEAGRDGVGAIAHRDKLKQY